jgi:hypothetical protein
LSFLAKFTHNCKPWASSVPWGISQWTIPRETTVHLDTPWLRQPVLLHSTVYLSGEASDTSFLVFGMTQPGIEPNSQIKKKIYILDGGRGCQTQSWKKTTQKGFI